MHASIRGPLNGFNQLNIAFIILSTVNSVEETEGERDGF